MHLVPKKGDRPVPKANLRTDDILSMAAPTAQWYTALMFHKEPEVLYAMPLAVKATPRGVEVSLPSKNVVPSPRRDVEIHYLHKPTLLLAPANFEPGQSKLAKVRDWSIDVSMDRNENHFRFTLAHGHPYVSFHLSSGDVRLTLAEEGYRIAGATPAHVLPLRVSGKPYAVFAPTGTEWVKESPTEWRGKLPKGKGYFSVAGMPDDRAETLALFTKHAYAFIDDTRVDWKVDLDRSKVLTTFTAVTKTMEGADHGPLLGLYPHQWFRNHLVQGSLGASYDTIRGAIKLLPAAQFQTELTYNGFVPYWPGVSESPHLSDLQEVMGLDLRRARKMLLEEGKGPYWQGKCLHRILKMMEVFEQQGDMQGRDKLLAIAKERAAEWFRGEGKSYFLWDSSQGAIASYPEEYYFVEQMNDHHFVYGYWIRVAADIALRDPSWIAKDKWGSMIDILVRDIATLERNGTDFPFLRNFDPYEGHSWAAGIPQDPFGSNQESSSEAVNAWAALILWGEITGNTKLRDAGIYLYTNEINSLSHYWFDLYGQVFAPEYKSAEASIVFAGKYVHNTWWTSEPRQIKGINFLPITTASTYLGRDPQYIKRSLGTLEAESKIYKDRGFNVDPPDMWQDIFAQTMALADPDEGLKWWNKWGTYELGDTRTHALHYMLSLQAMGTPDFEVTANTVFYSVFKDKEGKRTYLAFNAGSAPIEVKFSDGQTMTVAPGTLEKKK